MIVARRTQNKAVSSLNISEQYYSSIDVVIKSERFTSEQQSRPPSQDVRPCRYNQRLPCVVCVFV